MSLLLPGDSRVSATVQAGWSLFSTRRARGQPFPSGMDCLRVYRWA